MHTGIERERDREKTSQLIEKDEEEEDDDDNESRKQ